MSGHNQRRGFLSRMFTKPESRIGTQSDHPEPAPVLPEKREHAPSDPRDRTSPTLQAPAEVQPQKFTGNVVHLPVGPRGCRVVGVARHQLDFRGYTPGPVVVELRVLAGEAPQTKVVAVLLPNGKQVGTFYEDMGDEYAGVIEQLGSQGTVTHDAEIQRWEGGLGVELNLLHPEFLVRWAAAGEAERLTMPIRDYALRLAGTTNCQEAILKALGRSKTQKVVSAEVHAVSVPNGKYKGQPRLDFLHDGEKLGHLLPTRREQIPEIFIRAADGPVAVTLTIQYSSSGSHRVVYESEGR